jgi:CheY-like chemotaxis protein
MVMPEMKRLLVAGLEPAALAIVASWARMHEVQVCEADTAEQISLMSVQYAPQFALVDQRMEGRSGDQLLRQLLQQTPNLVCMLLGEPEVLAERRDLINDSGLFRLLLMPCLDSVLLRALDDALTFVECSVQGADITACMQRLTRAWQSRFEEKNREVAMLSRRLQVTNMMFDLLPEIMLGVSADGLIVEANERARQIFDEGGLVGRRIAEIVSPDALSVIQKCLNGDGATSASFVISVRGQKMGFRCLSMVLSGTMTGCLLYGGSKG